MKSDFSNTAPCMALVRMGKEGKGQGTWMWVCVGGLGQGLRKHQKVLCPPGFS